LKSASSDVGVAVELLRAAIRGAALNVDTNSNQIADKEFAAVVRAESQQIETISASQAQLARAAI